MRRSRRGPKLKPPEPVAEVLPIARGRRLPPAEVQLREFRQRLLDEERKQWQQNVDGS
jgi:hypothetical protein